MRWQIADFIFCEQHQTLADNSQKVQLEPMVVQLLSYFCRHPNDIVSRDQLIEEVWAGRIVTDNAVNRAITKLRKQFDDNPKQPQFIATFPKKGYKFIAPVKLLTEEAETVADTATVKTTEPAVTNEQSKPTEQAQALTSASSSSRFSKMAIIALLATVIVALFIFSRSHNQSPVLAPVTKVKALTRSAGQEQQPMISPDGTRLLYTEIKQGKMRLYLTNLETSERLEIDAIEDKAFWVGPGVWRKDGKQIAYLIASREQCMYYSRDIDGMSLSPRKLIYNCVGGSAGKILYTHNNNQMIFSENRGWGTPYSIFTLDLATNKTQRVNQPELFLQGNTQFDLHPFENKLLISAPDEQQWEGFYSLDLDTNELSLLFKQDAYICCGIWNHAGDRVVLMGEHPAYDIVSYHFDGRKDRVLYSGGQQLRLPLRHSNGRDYLFVAGHVNQNLKLFDIATKSEQTIADASVDERIATFANTSDKVAYISIASGNENIWIGQAGKATPKQLTKFDEHIHIVDLVFSPDDKIIAALLLNEILLVDAQTGDSQRLAISQTQLNGMSFVDNNTLAFSRKVNEQWRVMHVDLKTQQTTMADAKWQFINYQESPQHSLKVDQQGNLYVGENSESIAFSETLAPLILSNRAFNLTLHQEKWYWVEWMDNQYIVRVFDPSTEQTTNLFNTSSVYFRMKNGKILYGYQANSNADIFQTVSQ